jgi:hypothetical protein
VKLKLSWEQGKFLLQQGKVKQVKASQGKSRQVNKFAKQVAGSASDCSGLWLPTS